MKLMLAIQKMTMSLQPHYTLIESISYDETIQSPLFYFEL